MNSTDVAPNAQQAIPALQQRIQSAEQQASTTEQQHLAQRGEALAPIEAQMTQQLQQPMPERQKVDMPEWKPEPIIDPKDFQNYSMGLLAFGLIGGAFAKDRWSTVASSLNGAMEGYLQGNQMLAQKKYDDYKIAFDAAKQKETQANKEFSDLLGKRDISLKEMMKQYEILAYKYDRVDAQDVARRKDIGAMYKSLEHQQTALDKLQAQHDNLQFRKDMADRKYQAQQGEGQGGLTPEAIDSLAHQAMKDRGVLSNIGRGVQGAKDLRAIQNRMADIAKEQGLTGGDIQGGRASFRADQSSLSKLTQQYDAVTAFEKTAIKNGDKLMTLADKVDKTGIPALEGWIRSGRKSTGDPAVSAFDAQMQLYRTEAAKILTNPNLTGTLSDSARKEVEHFLGGNSSAEQIRSVVNLLKSDFEFRRRSTEEQMKDIKSRLVSQGSAGPKAGSHEDGYRFKGGDPAMPENWEKVQ